MDNNCIKNTAILSDRSGIKPFLRQLLILTGGNYGQKKEKIYRTDDNSSASDRAFNPHQRYRRRHEECVGGKRD